MLVNSAYKFIGNRLSPAGTRARLSILIYHRVLAETDPIFPNEVTAQQFDAQMARLKLVFNVLPLHEAVTRLNAGTLPARSVCITFDDGYADNLTLATPILKKHGLHATFFIATAYLNGGRMFNDTVIEAIRHSSSDGIDLSALGLGRHDVDNPQAKRDAINKILPKVKYLPLDQREDKVAELARMVSDIPLANDLMMTTEQLKALHAAGMGIGGHTSRHPILATLDDSALHQEIAEGKEFLETTLGEKIALFAYPNGKPDTDYLPWQVSIVRELGFDAAVSTQRGVSTQTSDLFQLPRFTPWHLNPSRYVPALLDNLRRCA
ncbi:polysaccharide deacetylase [Sulfurimicrobium lacus]|uniref:Polysaccharide deacetylase n=1 Tax=Sulfurimicrobium lacus TaxID=2715678 RepID=A0A6F8VB62_9PROT|nr:polysaccharide deacetylase family protein [Sulfurimicrobium lacus]BCB26570.1 polysaccharide deacetylase [Sulfurimicrobium lacus]